MRKRTKKESQKKEHIKQIATTLFAKYGFEGVSITDLCMEAGVNISMISYYFGGKTELYESIIADTFKKHHEFIETLIPLNSFARLSKEQQLDAFIKITVDLVDLCYNTSKDSIMLFLREQQNQNMEILNHAPVPIYLRQMLACILRSEIESRKVIFALTFIISAVFAPRLLPGFSLCLLKQEEFCQQDICMIKHNIRLYTRMLLKEFLNDSFPDKNGGI